jgi:hypothetical protein
MELLNAKDELKNGVSPATNGSEQKTADTKKEAKQELNPEAKEPGIKSTNE